MPAKATVELEWATASETDNDYFDVERSADARSWTKMGQLKGAGTVNTVRNYSWSDPGPLEGTSYYRLKIVDTKGKAEYSVIRMVKMNTRPAPTVYPNPATSFLNVSGKTDGDVTIYSLSGQKLGQIAVKSEKTVIPIQDLPVGAYWLKSGDGWSSKFIKH